MLGSENPVITTAGDYSKVKDQLTAVKDITFVDTNGKKIALPGDLLESAVVARGRRWR